MQFTSFASVKGVSQEEAAALAYDSRTANGLVSIQKLKWSHEAMADLIVSNPAISQKELAMAFGRTQAWISIIVNSDAFKAYLAKRQEEFLDPVLQISVRERFEAIVAKSTEVLLEKLSKPVDSIADSTVLKAAEIGAKALGVGGNAPPPAPAADHLSALAGRLLALQRGSTEVIEDVQVTRIEDRPGVRAERSSDRAETPDASQGSETGEAFCNGAQASLFQDAGGELLGGMPE